MVPYTFRLKAFLSKLSFMSDMSLDSSLPPPANYLYPFAVPSRFPVDSWCLALIEPKFLKPIALHTNITQMLFCKERRGVQHEFIIIISVCVQPQTETSASTSHQGWLRIDRYIDLNDQPKIGSLTLVSASSAPSALREYFAWDTVTVHGKTPLPSFTALDASVDTSTKVIGRRSFAQHPIPIHMFAAVILTMNRTVPMYHIAKGQCFWHAATIWKLLDEEYTTNASLSEADREKIKETNKFLFKKAGIVGVVRILYESSEGGEVSLRQEVQNLQELYRQTLVALEDAQVCFCPFHVYVLADISE